jgi:carbamoyltransferase
MMGRPRHVSAGDAQKGSFLGPAYGNESIGLFLDAWVPDTIGSTTSRELLDRVSAILEEDKVVGWFHGRMEYGPRALGARSIIGDPRSPEMQRTMNLKIKYRESFRPFAPCVLREHVGEFFETEPEQDWPYMLFVADVRDEVRLPLSEEDQARMTDPDLRIRVSVPRSRLPAVTHVDYSARVQTVDAERHGRYYRLMKRFHERTGCPVIVNTSFNIRGRAHRLHARARLPVLPGHGHGLPRSGEPLASQGGAAGRSGRRPGRVSCPIHPGLTAHEHHASAASGPGGPPGLPWARRSFCSG